MNGIVALAVIGIIIAVARSRHVEDRLNTTVPTRMPTAADPVPLLTNNEVAELRAQIARLEAEAAVARENALRLNRAKAQTGNPAEFATLATALDQSRQRLSAVAAESAAAQARLQSNADAIAAENAARAAAAAAMAPRKAELIAQNRALSAESTDAENAWNLLRTQRQSMAASTPEYKDILGYQITGNAADSEAPYATSLTLVDEGTEAAREITRLRSSNVTAVGWSGSGRTIYTNGNGISFNGVLIVTTDLRERARRIDEATIGMRAAQVRMNEIKATIERNNLELTAINEALTGNDKGIVKTKSKGGGNIPLTSLILPISHKN